MLSGLNKAKVRHRAAVAAVVMTVMAAVCGAPSQAAQASGRFDVTITLQRAAGTVQDGVGAAQSGLCRRANATGGFGATVTVVCSTGAVVDISSGESGAPWSPVHGDAPRYLMQISRAGQVYGTVDTYLGNGTVTSWRVLHLANWDYLELTVGW